MAITPLVLFGRIVTLDDDSTVIDDGALYIGADEHIAAAQERGAPAPDGVDDATSGPTTTTTSRRSRCTR